MELNLKDKRLSFRYIKSNDIMKWGKLIAKIDDIKTENVKYCLAVYLWREGKVTLTNFEMEEWYPW